MVKLGDENAAISRSAYETLVNICQSCNYTSVDELIARKCWLPGKFNITGFQVCVHESQSAVRVESDDTV